jgi:hypothetical protein
MKDLVPAATAPISLAADPTRDVLLCTLLPGAAPALVRESGQVVLGLQVQHGFGDPARDLGAVLEKALKAGPGTVGFTDPPGDGARLQDLVSASPMTVTVHQGFEFWLEDPTDATQAALLEQANAAAAPTARLAGVEAAYWTDAGSKEHLRWARPELEDELLDALARLHAAGRDRLVPDSRLVGMFRAYGLLVPVWDLPVGTGADAIEEPAIAVGAALAEALAEERPLTSAEQAARAGLAHRQVTLR